MAGLGQSRRPGRGGLRPVGGRDGLVDLTVPPEGTVDAAAVRLLNARNVKPREVVAVDSFGVTFLDKHGAVWTAWTGREELSSTRHKVTVRFEEGLPAFPTKA